MENDNFGQHITVDLKDCEMDSLIDTDIIYDFLKDMADKVGMNMITLPYVVKWLDPNTKIAGVSGFVIIAESHISVHTYPEQSKVFGDIFSCRNFNKKRAIDFFLDTFQPKRYETNTIKRGVPKLIGKT